MKQITEDYCSYETAKLLKEKGFDELSTVFYSLDGNDEITLYDYEPLRNSEIDGYAKVTHQLALKWLREVHDLHIIVYPWQADNEEKASHWCCTVYRAFAHLGNDVYTNETPKSYEEAIEAAVLYVLKNLI